ncbi:hypothetical protein ACLMJK_004138 [Lecanora helva]
MLSEIYGQRSVPSCIDEWARKEPCRPWVSAPVDNHDLSKGYQDINYGQFANAVNHATHWLYDNLPAASNPFQRFAYVGPKDLRYPLLAVAAGKLEKVVFIRPQSMASVTDEIIRRQPNVQIVTAPDLNDLLQASLAKPFLYQKSYSDAQDDP